MDYKAKPSSDLLCFDRNDFMKHDFSVDEFLHKNGKVPSLEQLRDNLGVYLKDLRSSMIDLINEDYADFVSLSANLVGLDQSIETIRKPLESFRDEIESLQQMIQENEDSVRSQLEQKKQLREMKRNLQSLKRVGETIRKLDELLANRLNEQIRVVDMERAALDLIEMKFNATYCEQYLVEENKAKLRELEEQILDKLRRLFKESLKSATSANAEQLERCLRIYVTLNSCAKAEEVFREDVVAPYMAATISEQNLQNTPQGLGGIYTKILNFISLHMTDILRLTQYTDKLRGFNFLLNSYWVDIEMRLETYMSSIFAPGNSEVFYAKYQTTKEFLAKMEALFASPEAITAFYAHKATKSFQSRWNLPVYFQICFQEIAGQFEASLEPLLRADSLSPAAPNETGFRLVPVQKAQKAFDQCWAEGVYLADVFPKFFKLSVQILIRLSRWISDVVVQLKAKKPSPVNVSQFLIALYTDTQRLIDRLSTMESVVVRSIPANKRKEPLVSDSVTKSFTNIQDVLYSNLTNVQGCLVAQLIAECSTETIRQVNDLPRLYRKTNRDVPSKSSAYVEQMLKPLKTFQGEQSGKLGEDIVEDILAQVCSRITVEYHEGVVAVLTSVQKTEESLRRLRNVKIGSQQQSAAATAAATGAATISDDDKIRLQLRIDVKAWTAELEKMNLLVSQVEKLTELNDIVEESTKAKE